MPALALRSLISARSGILPALGAMREAMGSGISIFDPAGKLLFGESPSDSNSDAYRATVQHDGTTLGFVAGPAAQADALALLLSHIAARESEGRALASEVLHLYREIHLIEQLSEQLAPLLNCEAVAKSALEQAQRLISATHGSILIIEKEDGPLTYAASFQPPGDPAASEASPMGPESRLAASIVERGVAEIVNDAESDQRLADSKSFLKSLMCAPLRGGRRTVGVIVLANSGAGTSYSAADLKLLNTIALQTAAAIENSLLVADMVSSARERAAYAAELQAASTVQQLLMQSASGPTPGFQVDSVYLPASEVGGDFFFVSPVPGGSINAIVGDVSGKGLTAAMRVAMILGALRRETSHDPGEILFGLNNVLLTQGQLGFTTACCVQVSPKGNYLVANAGHISPFVSGIEVETPPEYPLGIAPDRTYKLVQGKLGAGERMVLMSDGVPEARSESSRELYGFDRLPELTLLPAQEIAEAARRFGQEDDITVLTLAIAPDAGAAQ